MGISHLKKVDKKISYEKNSFFLQNAVCTESNLKMCYCSTLCAFSVCANEELAMTSEYKITVRYAIKQMQISPEQKLVLNKEMAHLFRMQAKVKTEIR